MSNLDETLQEELLNFVREQSADKSPKPLKEILLAEILKQIIAGDRTITGIVTNNESGDIFVRFSLMEESK